MQLNPFSERTKPIGGTLPQSTNQAIPVRIPKDCLPANMSEAEVNELFASCLPRLKKAVRTMLSNEQDSEDALQDALLLAYRKLDQFEGRSSFLTWLHSIVRNTSRVHYRRNVARQTISIEPQDADQALLTQKQEFVETGPSPEEICIQKERSEILRRTARKMPARYRPAIHYFHLEGLGEQETARRLQITESAVKSQLHRSRRILTARIRRLYVSRVAGGRICQPLAHHLSGECGRVVNMGS
jgi:RNA polymerase sigma-70 factor (ECF subfamily)